MLNTAVADPWRELPPPCRLSGRALKEYGELAVSSFVTTTATRALSREVLWRHGAVDSTPRTLPLVARVERRGQRTFVVVVSIPPGRERARADVAELAADGRLVVLDWRAGHDRRGTEAAASMAVEAAARVIPRLAAEAQPTELHPRALGPGGVRRIAHRRLALID